MSERHLRSSSIKVIIGLSLWTFLSLYGFFYLLQYDHKESAYANISQDFPKEWLPLPPENKKAVVLNLHPHCPCSKASLREYQRIISRYSQQVVPTVVFYKPEGKLDSWVHGDLYHNISNYNIHKVIDEDGRRMEEVGIMTSGHVLVYDDCGKLLYQGGITASRGHEGTNRGSLQVEAVIAGSSPLHQQHFPVFGCEINDAENES